jgi:signal transduction histidine kinase
VRSVFSKTLLWFFGTALLTTAAIVILAALTHDDEDAKRPMLRNMLEAQLLQSEFLYALYGPQVLNDSLGHLRRSLNAEAVVMTDRLGRDLVTGLDRPDLVRAADATSAFHFLPGPRSVLMQVDEQTGVRLFLVLQRRSWFQWYFSPFHLMFVLGLVGLLCYAFARNLTHPVQTLRAAVEGFGRGEFDQRVHFNRSDEIGQLGDTFNQMADRIQTLLAAERRLLGDISHELRSPLARLSLAVELARTSPDPAPQLDRIQKEADRLNALVGELLQVTRAEGDPSMLRKEQVPLGELVHELVEDARVEAEARGCGLEYQERETATICGDEELLRRAIENVLRNAIRYEPAGSNVAVTVEGPSVTVRDHGPGVPEESLDRIFDAFYRVESDRDRASGGVGLGLSIAKRAVALHKGTIVAQNANPGLSMRITLPAGSVAANEAALASIRS